jgi:uncharacterized cofD-like protein
MTKEGQTHIVTIGGGTGTFVVLSGLKRLPNVYLTAIVSVVDDGGSTGRLRDAYGILPPGDARQAIIALADDADGTSLMRSLFSYRFGKGDIAGHNFGNLFLTALSDILGSGPAAIEAASKVLRVNGRVLPISENAATLVATLENGQTIVGEHMIDERMIGRSPIASLSTKENARASQDSLEALKTADIVVLGPGDLYASTLADFAVLGLSEAVATSKARLVYIVNLFTKAGQTDEFTAQKHVAEITKHVGRKPDLVLVHTGPFSADVLERYAAENEFPVTDDLPQDMSVVRGSFADVILAEKDRSDVVPRSLIRHNPEKIAHAIQALL